VAARPKKRTRGGRRQGAGRPPLFEESADLTVRFPREDLEALGGMAAERGVSTAEMVREAVRRYVARRRRE
jgi:predicted HicB family RNase H-like nuclease